MRNLLFVFALTFTIISHSADRYWIAAGASNWNNTANWSTTSGGAGGASVPGAADVAIFNANGNGNCNLDIPTATLGGMTVNGYTAIIDLNGNTISVTSGNVTLTTGTINDGPNLGVFSLNTTGTTRFNGATIGAAINGSSGRVRLDGSVFNNTVNITKTGAGNDGGAGGNTFNSTVTLGNSSTDYLMTGNTNPDVFNGTLNISNTGSDLIYLAHNSAGNQFNANVNFESTGTSNGIRIAQSAGATATLATGQTFNTYGGGYTSGDLRIYNTTQASATGQNLTLTGTARLYMVSTTWNGNVNFSSARIYTQDCIYNGTAVLSKTGASDDASPGGNTFTQDLTINNSGSGYFMTCNGNPDTYSGNVSITNSGTDLVYFADNAAGISVAGNVDISNTGAATGIRVARLVGSTVTVGGNLTLTDDGTADHANYLANNGTLTITGNLIVTNNCSATSTNHYVSNGTTAQITVNGTSDFINNGTGATSQRYWIGDQGTATFNGDVTAQNNSSATNSEIFFHRTATGIVNFNENIIIESTVANSDGVSFGESAGTGTLAAGKTITIGVGGFVSGDLYLRNFTQVGATAQSLSPTGTTIMHIRDSNWGGDVSFTSPRINTRETVYSGTVYIEKTGSTNDNSAGGNTFVGNTTLVNSSDGQLGMGNGNPDDFQSDLIVNNSGSYRFEMAMNSAGNTIGGDFTLSNSGTSTVVVICNNAASTLDVTGNTIINNTTSAANSSIYIGNAGDVVLNGDFSYNMTPTGATHNSYIANGADSEVTIGGITTLNNDGAGATTQRIFFGNQGDIITNGDLTINNSSNATNSEVFVHYNTNSVAQFNENIILNCTGASSDGIRFGQANGTGTLAATKTITIGGGGFVSGDLRLDGFTQVGPTAQTLTATGTTRIIVVDSDWGGDIDFHAPRMVSTGTLYNGTGLLEKTGGIADDVSSGGNKFVGDFTLRNTGSEYIMFGNGTADTCLANLTLDNASSAQMYWANNSNGNIVNGDLVGTMSNTSTRLEICANVNSTIEVDGTATLTSTSAAASSTMIVGNSGDVTFNGDLSMTDNSTGAVSYTYLANATDASAIINGDFLIEKNPTGATETRAYIGNQGDVTFNGTFTANNNSGANNNHIYVHYSANSVGIFNENIVVTATDANSDGVSFGENGGSGTLAATKTVTIGGGGFVAGDLEFRNFTQIGPTAQNLTCTGTARIYNYDSNWGGDITFIAPRQLLRGTTFNLTSYIEKTGASNDQSLGGNTFVGDCELRHTGSDQLLFGNGVLDHWQANLLVNNFGSGRVLIANSGVGHLIEGTLDWNRTGNSSQNDILSNANGTTLAVNGNGTFVNSGTGGANLYIGNGGSITFGGDVDITHNTSVTATSSTRFADGANSVISVAGNLTLVNSGSNTTSDCYIANSGTVTISGTADITSSGSGTTNRIYVSNATGSSIVFGNTATVTNNSTATGNTQIYIGNQGAITTNGLYHLINNSGATNSGIYCNYNTNSVGTYNENITVQCTDANSDGIRFGEATGSGTLAATKTITVGVGGFVAGDLQFRNFTQVGPTAQALTCTGTARIYNYDSNWGGDITFVAPRQITRGTTYQGTSYIEKTGATDDVSVGGNTFEGDCQLVNNGTDYLLMGNSFPDVWNGDLDATNNSTDNMYIANNALGNTIAGNLTWVHTGNSTNSYISNSANADLTVSGTASFTNTSSGVGSVYIGNSGDATFNASVTAVNNPSTAGTSQIRIAEATSSQVIIDGATILNNIGSATTSQIVVGNNGDADFNSTLDVTNAGSGTTSQVYIGNSANAVINVAGNATLDQSGGITTTRIYAGNNANVTWNGDLAITNSSSSTNSDVRMNYSGSAISAYNGNITVTSEDANCDGVRFGQNGGTGTLAAGQTVAVGGGGFIAGDLRFRNWTQLGASAQNVVCTGTARIYQHDAIWNADANFEAPRYYTNGSTYEGLTTIEKNGASNDDSPGGNTFNSDVSITNSGSGRLRMSQTNGTPDDFNGDATWIQTGTGALQPSRNNTDTYAGDINVNTVDALYFGLGGNGRVLMDGTTAQSWNDLGASPLTLTRDFQVNKASEHVTMNMPLEITVELDLDQGIVNTTSTNLITMRDNSTVSSVSNASHIDGPIEKIGNDAFVFPVGDSSLYRPISISNPSSGSARFRAEYVNDDPHPTYDHLSKDPSIHHISSCEHWFLDRIASTNNVFVTLSFDNVISCGVDDLSELLVARWDGTTWKDHGQSSTTGTTASGTVTSLAAVTNFSPFTLASTTGNNPLPVELLDFTATLNKDVVNLDWSTSSETDNDYFNLEKSADGITWETIAKIDGAGTSTTLTNYAYPDKYPYLGINYYRLKQVDFNGEYEYSPLQSVNYELGTSDDLSIYPNPTNDIVYILGDANKLETIEIYNALGQKVNSSIIVSGQKATIDLSHYEAGVYYLKTPYSIDKIIKQ
ncbi:MAG: T9SS type A sorting domain-containing protein [Crocinitomicaceae bacterium]